MEKHPRVGKFRRIDRIIRPGALAPSKSHSLRGVDVHRIRPSFSLFFFFFTSDKWISVYSKPELNSKRQRDELKLEGKGNFSSFRVSKKLCFFLPELIVFIRAPAIFSRATYTGRGARFVVSSFHRSRSKSRLPSSRGR